MSSLLLLNGSPRGAKANTAILLAALAEGWDGQARTLHLASRAEFDEATRTVLSAAEDELGESAVDTVVLAAPLYTDAMPALVKSFLEELEPAVGRLGSVRLGFIVHSGFSEAAHSRHLERYYERLTYRLGADYAGTIVKGGSEGLRMMPDGATAKLRDRLAALGASLEGDGALDSELLRQVAGRERLGLVGRVFYEAFGRTPLARWYWDTQLKKNGAWGDRWAAPYGDAA